MHVRKVVLATIIVMLLKFDMKLTHVQSVDIVQILRHVIQYRRPAPTIITPYGFIVKIMNMINEIFGSNINMVLRYRY